MPKILYIGFGISPFSKGGAVSYQDSLMEGFISCGWEVSAFFAAPRYTFGNKPHIKIWHRNGIKFLELYNGPYIPEHQNNPEKQCSYFEIEKLTRYVLKEENPDIVHIHELQFHPVSIIDIISDFGIPVIKTMHNYYDICPQRDLMYQGKFLCSNLSNAERCAKCLSVYPQAKITLKQKIVCNIPLPLIFILRKILDIIKFKKKKNRSIRISQRIIYTPQQYLYRKNFFIERLNKLDAVHFSSHRIAHIFANNGVLREKIKVIPLSTKSIDLIYPKPIRDKNYPVVFGFTGGKSFRKGYDVLVKAFSKLDQKKARLVIWGTGERGILQKGLSIELRKYYDLRYINNIFQEIDIGVIPSIWEEVFGIIGIEMISARIPVIGSRIGGITEWLKNGENGFLIEPGNVENLYETMKLFIDNPNIIAKIQKNMKQWKNFSRHQEEMADFYREIITSKNRKIYI